MEYICAKYELIPFKNRYIDSTFKLGKNNGRQKNNKLS